MHISSRQDSPTRNCLEELRSPDREIVAKAGEELSTLVSRISGRVCPDSALKEDACQTTLLHILRRAQNGQFNNSDGDPHNYVETAFRRTFLDLWHKEKRQARFVEKEEKSTKPKDELSRLADQEEQEIFAAVLDSLNREDKQIFTDFEFNGVTAEEIGGRLGMTRTAVFERIRRLRTDICSKIPLPLEKGELSTMDLRREVFALTDHQREAFVLVDILGWKKRAVDRAQNLRIGTTDNRLKSAHENLYRSLGREWPMLVDSLRGELLEDGVGLKALLGEERFQLLSAS
ncbi:MAG: sigma-70 family RNA polymerase sigma factor [Bdellovibrionales bacterium]|nr:sigma-70 family RNA polymerase sigma factor [Bdellovibrionales bacterium]